MLAASVRHKLIKCVLMSVTFRILQKLGLVYVRYEGQARLTDTTTAFAA